MTTVTEAIKPILDDEGQTALDAGDVHRICADPNLARRFARELAEAARSISKGRRWTPDELREVLEVAVHGVPQKAAQLLEGRYFRKRLREQINLADRYGDSFATVVITLRAGVQEGVYSSVLDAVTERLRRTDMVFLYRRRFAVVLPRMSQPALGPMLNRVRDLVSIGAGAQSIERLSGEAYPSPRFKDSRAVLAWAEDQLRDQPMGD